MPALQSAHNGEHYTYADYCTWNTDERWELIDGVPYLMAPAPSDAHQNVSGQLFLAFGNFLRGKPCEVRHAPYDVRLNADNEDDTVVQPDLAVICDSSKIDSKGCKGAPDLIVEILSPTSGKHDRWVKYNQYMRAGVKEYWIVDIALKTVDVNLLQGGRYSGRTYGGDDTVPVTVLPGCEIPLRDIFPAEPS